VACVFEHGSGHSGSIKGEGFLEKLIDYHLFKDSATRNCLKTGKVKLSL
jgi:hypothetical protein